MSLVKYLNYLLTLDKYKELFALLKGIRNGIAYVLISLLSLQVLHGMLSVFLLSRFFFSESAIC